PDGTEEDRLASTYQSWVENLPRPCVSPIEHRRHGTASPYSSWTGCPAAGCSSLPLLPSFRGRGVDHYRNRSARDPTAMGYPSGINRPDPDHPLWRALGRSRYVPTPSRQGDPTTVG